MSRTTLFLFSALTLATPLWAAEEGAGNPFSGNIGNALWTLIVFALVVIVLGRYAWGPLLSALQEREAFIRNSLSEAKTAREEAEARLKEYEERLAQAHGEVAALIEEARRDAQALRHRIEGEAREEAEKMIARGKREISLAQDAALKDIYASSAELITQVASRVVRRELKARDHQRLIDESLEELGSLPEN